MKLNTLPLSGVSFTNLAEKYISVPYPPTGLISNALVVEFAEEPEAAVAAKV